MKPRPVKNTFFQQAAPAAGGDTLPSDAAANAAVAAAEIEDLKNRLEMADRLVEESAEKIQELEEKSKDSAEVKKLESQLELAKNKEARTINVIKSKWIWDELVLL